MTEYLLHRWLGHHPRSRSRFTREHLKHHRLGNDFGPWREKLLLAAVVVAPLSVVSVAVAGTTLGLTFTVSFVGTWLAYEALHRDLHVRAPLTRVGRFLRQHHMHHHHVDPRVNHGVSTPLWDLCFGTWRTAGRIRIHQRKAPVWLLSAPADAVWRDDYEVIPSPAPVHSESPAADHGQPVPAEARALDT